MIKRSIFLQNAISKPYYTYLYTLLQFSPIQCIGVIYSIIISIYYIYKEYINYSRNKNYFYNKQTRLYQPTSNSSSNNFHNSSSDNGRNSNSSSSSSSNIINRIKVRDLSNSNINNNNNNNDDNDDDEFQEEYFPENKFDKVIYIYIYIYIFHTL